MTRPRIKIAKANKNKNKNKSAKSVKQLKKEVIAEEKEVTRLGAALRQIGSIGGAAVGSIFGQSTAGSAVGNNIGAAVSKWLGSGDYTVSSNSIVQKAASGVPMMHKEGQSVVIRHREFLRQIRPTTGFEVQAEFAINPGVVTSFPWLSGIARQYEQYEVRGMVFHYVPTSGAAISGTNSSLGSVMIYTTYRTSDRAPTTKLELLNEYWANETVPSETMVHPIECNPRENPFNVHYVRSNGAVGEPLMYDLGRTFVATQGMQGTLGTVGDLWVTYEIELKKPIVGGNAVDNATQTIRKFNYTAATALFNSPTTSYGQLNISTTSTNNTIVLPAGVAGQYYFYVDLTSSTTILTVTNAWEVAATCVNCSVLGLGDSPYFRATVATATGLNRASYWVAVNYDGLSAATVTIPTPSLTYSGSPTLLTTLTVYHFGMDISSNVQAVHIKAL